MRLTYCVQVTDKMKIYDHGLSPLLYNPYNPYIKFILAIKTLSFDNSFRQNYLLIIIKYHQICTHLIRSSVVYQVATMKMHAFTLIQIVLVVILWIVKSTIAAIVFPLLVFLMIPLRLKILPKIFTHDELEVVSELHHEKICC